MKSYFRFAGLLASLCAAQAHESWAPHTHTLGQQHSDIFVLSLGVLAALGVGFLLVRLFRQRGNAELSGPPQKRLARTPRGGLSPFKDRAE